MGTTGVEVSTKTVPRDLALSTQLDTNKDYLNVIADNLTVSKLYNFQFQWIFEDGTLSDWSATYPITSASENTPGAPSGSVPSTSDNGIIPVTLSTFPSNAYRVDIFITGGVFGSGKVVNSFYTAGIIPIPVAAGTYTVSLVTVLLTGLSGAHTTPITVVVTTLAVPVPLASVIPSVPTVSPVLGAIQLAWDGKTSTGGSQPYGFGAALVYVGLSAGFIPGPTNQVDVLNFANGQNTLNIGVGTVVEGTPMTYGVDYYIKIATTNGSDLSDAVSATGNPVRVGQVGSGDIISIAADKIATGTLDVGAVITVGAPTGKRVVLSGSGNIPFGIYGTGGTPLLTYDSTADLLTVVGAITITSGSTYNAINTAQSTANTALSTANSAVPSGQILVDLISTSTYIDGPRIRTGAISSQGYTGPSINGSDFSSSPGYGMKISLDDGSISARNFRITSTGDAYFRGVIEALGGTFTGTITGGSIIGSVIKSSSGLGYISLGETAGTIEFQVPGVTYPGYITNESYFGGTVASLVIGAPSNSNVFSTSTYIMLDAYTGGGIITLNSASSINIGGPIVNVGADSASSVQLRGNVNISGQVWSPGAGETAPAYKLLGITQGGSVAQAGISIWKSTASGAPSNTQGMNGDLWFTSG